MLRRRPPFLPDMPNFAMGIHEEFEAANAMGLKVLSKLFAEPSEVGTRFEGHLAPGFLVGAMMAELPPPPAKLNPIPPSQASARGLLFLRGWHGGLLLGGIRASGFAIARGEHAGWSAPLFMRLTRLEAGALLGAERLHALMAALTDRAAGALANGVPQALGADFALDLWPLVGSEEVLDLRAEHTATIYGTTVDYATASTGRGVLLDASVARGAARPDAAKNRRIYGDGGGRDAPSARAILRGGVPPPAELAPLYARIAAIARRAADR